MVSRFSIPKYHPGLQSRRHFAFIVNIYTPLIHRQWYAGKGKKNPETFSEQDEQLSEQIYQLNGIVRDLNKELGSPEFSSDLLNNNKHRSGSKRTAKKKRQYNFNLYKDGIHPGDLLAKAWLRKIEEQAKRLLDN